MIKTIAPGGDSTSITYNNLALPLAVTDPLGRTVLTLYDSVGNVTARVSPSGDSTRYEYDTYGNLAAITDPVGRTTSYSYDIAGRLLSETDPAGNTTRYTYDISGRLDSLVDPKGHATTFEYDAAGNMTRSTNQLGISRNYTYDEQGKLVQYTNARGMNINYEYDILKRLISKTTPDSSVLARFGYDNMGNMTYAATPFYSVNRSFDPAGRLIQELLQPFKESDTLGMNDTITADNYAWDYSDLVIDGGTVIIDGEHHFLSLTLLNGAVVKHLPTTINMVHRLSIFAQDFISIDATSKIDVTGLGYLGGGRGDNDTTAGRTDGNSLVGGSPPGTGGSHGGRGGPYIYTWGGRINTINFAANPYDNRLWPVQPGGGGGSNGNPGFNGGGVVHLNAPKILLDGSIITNGETAVNDNGGAGAGGSIIVEADSIFGSGNVFSNGGDGIIGFGGELGDGIDGGGGGGRVLIVTKKIEPINITVNGGNYGGALGSKLIFDIGELEVTPLLLTNNDTTIIDKYNDSWDNAVVIIDNSVLVVNGEHHFKRLFLTNNALLTHSLTDTNSCEGMILNISDSLYIDATSKINVSGKGYAGGNKNICAETQDFNCGATGLSGGSYSGFGGAVDGFSGRMFGSNVFPRDLGAGGAYNGDDSLVQGGNGGGRVEINVPKIIVNGCIRADGAGEPLGGGGSGGAILINTEKLSGSGYISANGGSSYHGGGGSGGRISLHGCNFNLLKLNQVWASGGYGVEKGEDGTVYEAANDSLYTKAIRFYDDSIITFESITVNIDKYNMNYEDFRLRFVNCDIKITGNHSFRSAYFSGGAAELTGKILINDTLDFLNSCLVNHTETDLFSEYSLSLFIVKNITIDNTSKIDVTGRGYWGEKRKLGEQYSGARTLGNLPGATGDWAGYYQRSCSGGSYGGVGSVRGGSTNPVYGDTYHPINLGSGGSCTLGWASAAGDGGGAVYIETRNMFLDGYISADGENSPNLYNNGEMGGGSGGSILIFADTIIGNGELHSNGGYGYAGGGGGRIAIYSEYLGDSIGVNVSGIAGGTNGTYILGQVVEDSIFYPFVLKNPGVVGNEGTISFIIDSSNSNHDNNNVIITGTGIKIIGNHNFENLSLDNSFLVLEGNITFTNVIIINSAVKVNGNLQINGNFEITDNSLVTQYKTTLTNEYYLRMYVGGELLIDSSSSINVSEKGYWGQKQISGQPFSQARTLGNVPGAVGGYAGYYQNSCSGGSFGGMGSIRGGNTNAIYGDFYFPVELGSGGSANTGWLGAAGDGGGAVYIEVNKLNLNGFISADGQNSPAPYGNYMGGGSGGSVLIFADTIIGSGEIRSNGGSGFAGGGGGRIALYGSYVDNDSLTISALGGSQGAPGTIFLRDSTRSLGVLIVDNNGQTAPANSTPLIAIAPGTVTGLTPDTLYDTNATFSPFVKGHLVKLNYDYVSTFGAHQVLSVDTHALIVDTTDGNLFTSGNVGNDYIGVYAFDSIIVTGGARVTTPGLVFYNNIFLNNGWFTSHTGTQTGSLNKPGYIPEDVRLAMGKKEMKEVFRSRETEVSEKKISGKAENIILAESKPVQIPEMVKEQKPSLKIPVRKKPKKAIKRMIGTAQLRQNNRYQV